MKKTPRKERTFDSLQINLASPEDILKWSHGEVSTSRTINYRTFKPDPGGLFCEKIFGPENDFQCSCGKYKGSQFHGIVCDECGVEVTRSNVRRERMGHINLATPIAHIWYLKKVPSRIALLLGLSKQEVEKVVYFSAYLISDVNEAKRKELEKKLKDEFDKSLKDATREETKIMLQELYKQRIKELGSIEKGGIIDETEDYVYSKQFPGLFIRSKGGEAIYNALKNLDLKKMEKTILKELETASAVQTEKLNKQLIQVRSFLKTGKKPEHMFLTKLPIIPPGIRPLVSIDGGKMASSDLNELYRHAIIRNNRLKEFIESKAPKVFIDTEKRMLQEAVDALIDREARPAGGRMAQKGKELKSIAHYLGSKEGIFRSNLLGKRVDYSGRSVIVVGPHLKIDECGLPKTMALELFRPFVIGNIIQRDLRHNIKGANRMIDDGDPIVWEILDEVVKDKYVLLNRQPTLHRQGIMAYKPRLVEGKAIEISPLVCEAYNADFDGDQMAVYVPISDEAQEEAKKILIASNNIIKVGTGEVNVAPRMDMTLGCYWMTKNVDDTKGAGKTFATENEAIAAFDAGAILPQTKIKVLMSDEEKYGEYRNQVMETTVGRILFNNILPPKFPFVNEEVTSKVLKNVVKRIVELEGAKETVPYLDAIKKFGFRYVTESGTTFALTDLVEPKEVKDLIEEGKKESDTLEEQYNLGLLSVREKKRKKQELWQKITSQAEEVSKKAQPASSSIVDMIASGSRGNFSQLNKMVGILGVVDSAKGEPIERPILSSLKEGLNSIDFFNFSYGARKGVSDTALKTATAGYLTRKLASVTQEICIKEKDCGTTKGHVLYRKSASPGIEISFAQRIKGRFTSKDVKGEKVSVKRNTRIDDETARAIEEDKSITEVEVRSPIYCNLCNGVCAKCYGDDKVTNETIDIGEAVGILAAQSIGEPGTQLTMRTFHAGGTAVSGGDITAGLPRINEIFDRITPKALAIIAHADGVVEKIGKHEHGHSIVTLHTGAKKVAAKDKEYHIPLNRELLVKEGDTVEKGQFLTDGSADLQELLTYAGKQKTEQYIFKELNKVYELQGYAITPTYFELIIRQMFSRFLITDPGDSSYTKGEYVDMGELDQLNKDLKKKGLKPIVAEPSITGITSVSTSRTNFLAAASFQNTTSVFIRSAIQGVVDTLDGLKENVILGRLVPTGTAFEGSKKYKLIEKKREEIQKRLAEKEEMSSNE